MAIVRLQVIEFLTPARPSQSRNVHVRVTPRDFLTRNFDLQLSHFFLVEVAPCTMKLSITARVAAYLVAVAATTTDAFSISTQSIQQRSSVSTELGMGLFDKWTAQGDGKDSLDEQWENQQAILAARRKPKSERDAYFKSVEDRRDRAYKEQSDKWAWQTKTYKKGEDPLTEWKKRRDDGTIESLENQYGDPKKIGGIPMPMASFGVGGEFGVGGKMDNGGRFDLRLPYADQGYVDDESDVMAKLGSFFGGNKKKPAKEEKQSKKEEPKKKNWPF